MLVEPYHALSGTTAVAELVVEEVGPLARVDAVIELPEPPRRVGQQVEPFRLDRGITAVCAGCAERVEARLPVVPRSGLAGLDELIHARQARADQPWSLIRLLPSERRRAREPAGSRFGSALGRHDLEVIHLQDEGAVVGSVEAPYGLEDVAQQRLAARFADGFDGLDGRAVAAGEEIDVVLRRGEAEQEGLAGCDDGGGVSPQVAQVGLVAPAGGRFDPGSRRRRPPPWARTRAWSSSDGT